MPRILVIVLIFFITHHSFAQQKRVLVDFGFWGGIILKKKLPKGFQISLEQQLRTYKNSLQIDDYLADLGLKYTINKNFRLGGNFRYIHDLKRWKATENSLRYNVDLQYRAKIAPAFQLSYRVRYQQRFIDCLTEHRTPIREVSSALRNKVKAKFKYTKKQQFYLSTELFVSYEKFKDPAFHKLRFLLGSQTKTQLGDFNYALGYEVHLQPNDSFSFFFIKTIYSLNL